MEHDLLRKIEIDESIFKFVDKERPVRYPFEVFCKLCMTNLFIHGKKNIQTHMVSAKHSKNQANYYVIGSKNKSKEFAVNKQVNQAESDESILIIEENKIPHLEFEASLKEATNDFVQKVNQSFLCFNNELRLVKDQNNQLLGEICELKNELNNVKQALDLKTYELVNCKNAFDVQHDQNQQLQTKNKVLKEAILANSGMLKQECNQDLSYENKELKLKFESLKADLRENEAKTNELSKKIMDFICSFETFTKSLKIDFNVDCTEFNRGLPIDDKLILYSNEFKIILKGLKMKEDKCNQELKTLYGKINQYETKIEQFKNLKRKNDKNETSNAKKAQININEKNKI